MRGSIFKQKGQAEGSWTIVLSLGKDAAGKRLRQCYTVRGNKHDAEKKLRELLSHNDRGTLTKPSKLTVAAYLDQWLRDYRPTIAPNTAQTYEFFIEKHIKPAIGSLPLTGLTPSHVQRLYSDKLSSGRKDGTGGLSGRSVRYIHVTLHRALKSAVKLGIISRNVCDNVDVPSIERHEMLTMSEDNIQAFLEAAKSTPYYALFHSALFTGMRRSELLALRWCDMDLLMCQASISRTLHRLNNGEIIFKKPKTAKSRRLVALSPTTVKVLREHKASQETERLLDGKLLQDSDLIFAQPDGKPLLPDTVSHAFVVLARRVGLEGIHFHSARHSHATLLLKKNTHPAVVMQRLGHSNITVTINTYSHVMPSLQNSAAKDFDDIVSLPPTESPRQ